jgi:hypothetical protein
VSRLAADALTLCEGFGSSGFRTSGGEVGRGLLDDEEMQIEPYGTPGQSTRQRRREFRVVTKKVTDYGIANDDTLWVRDAVTEEEAAYKVADLRRETDAAVTVIYLKAL